MRRYIYKVALLLVVGFATVGELAGQTAKDDIWDDLRRSASNYYAYPAPSDIRYTNPPRGYEPIYLSMYARHGSRFLIDPADYQRPLRVLAKADSAGALTTKGKEVMAVVAQLSAMAKSRYGELTEVGARQHRELARRLFERYPEVFGGQAFVEARSTPVPRCILSMLNECSELKGLNPQLQVRTDASEHDLYYMNRGTKAVDSFVNQKAVADTLAAMTRRLVNPKRLMTSLFADTAYLSRERVDGQKLMKQLFSLASNMQSHDTRLDLYRYFIREECYALWKIDNYAWYCYFGPSPLSRGMMPLSQANLLGNIISVADTSLASEGRCRATLRFGHEVCVMPLACLMQLSSSDKDNAKSQAVANCGFSSFSPDSVETYWRNYNIFPMCSNVQLVFYKNKKKPELPILVKVLLNEREATLPLATETQPYYPWDKVKKFYREYLADKGIKADFGKQTDIF